MGVRTPPTVRWVLPELTPRELQVALEVAEGASNKEVAAALFVTEKAVEGHLRNIFRKLEIRSRLQLAQIVHRWLRPQPPDGPSAPGSPET